MSEEYREILRPVEATSTAPADVLKQLETSRQKQIEYENKLQEASVRAERERQFLQKTINENANPSPLVIALLVIGVLAALYLFYVFFLKPNLSGEWVDNDGNLWQINHNRLAGTFSVKINNKPGGSGQVIDNFVSFGEMAGVWNYNNYVVFIGGWVLERVK